MKNDISPQCSLPERTRIDFDFDFIRFDNTRVFSFPVQQTDNKRVEISSYINMIRNQRLPRDI